MKLLMFSLNRLKIRRRIDFVSYPDQAEHYMYLHSAAKYETDLQREVGLCDRRGGELNSPYKSGYSSLILELSIHNRNSFSTVSLILCTQMLIFYS